MSFYEKLKQFIGDPSRKSNEFSGVHSIRKSARKLTIRCKHHLKAQDISPDQELIDKVVRRVIKKDGANRYYAGKQDNDIKQVNEKIYKYESFRTQKVKLIPLSEEEFDLFIENHNLGQLPKNYSQEVKHYLQTTIVMAFAYVKGGPYKYFDKDSQQIVEEDEPFDLNIYLQFS